MTRHATSVTLPCPVFHPRGLGAVLPLTVAASLLAGGTSPSAAASSGAAQQAARPNLVLIVADDLGIGDVGCYSTSEASWTPHIDRLASQGVRAIDAHVTAAVCTPSRYAMMTGRYYWQNWIGELLVDTKRPTIASVFRDNGYATAYFGKWHLGWGELRPDRKHRQDIDWNGQFSPGVLECGFDTYFGTPFSHNEPPFVFVEDRRVVGLDPDDPLLLDVPSRLDPDQTKRGFGVSTGAKAAHAARPVDRIDLIVTDRAVEFIRRQARRPFFLNLALVAPHVPIAPAEEFRGRTGAGAYADFVLQMDACVGRVVQTLEECGLADNTLLIVTSDNGAVIHREVLALPHLSNLDLLGQKTDAWEGGVRIPLIARWPARIPAETTTDALISLADLARTTWVAAGIVGPADAAPISLDQLPVLLDPRSKSIRNEMLYLGTNAPYLALRSGDWVFMPGQGSLGMTTDMSSSWLHLPALGQTNSDYDEQGRLRADAPQQQLYNLREDPRQLRNVIREHPEKAAELAERHAEMFREL